MGSIPGAAQPGIHPESHVHPEPPIDVHSPVAEHAAEIVSARKDILRIATAGSVDDGKSTLIGRLLYDSKAIFEDQYEAVERASKGDYVDLALLTDGLRAEREQGITIDVAYRYFSTPRRTFILADTPGHVQYTRNMVTGASTADLAIVLVDARKGMLEQSRRHAFLASLLRVPHLVVAVNKMDLVGWSEQVYEKIRDEFSAFATKLNVPDLTVVPISALNGDNVVTHSANTPWYEGTTLLHHLEHVHVASDRNLVDPRFPVQYVIRPQSDAFHDYRGYAGTMASGVLRPGDEVQVLPSGLTTRIAAIDGPRGPVDEAFPPMAVTVRLEDDVDVSRGDLICRPANAPVATQDVDALVCWMADEPLRPRQRIAIKHTTRTVRGMVKELTYRLDVNTLHRDPDAGELGLNDIGRVRLRVTQPLFVDDYTRNRVTGRFILIDEATNATVGAGMLTPAG
jgi:sulfate adenylyltransferase large subunit